MKKLIIALLALALVFTFAACGGGDNGGGETAGGETAGGDNGGAAAKDVVEISHEIVWGDGLLTMSVEKNEDGTPKYEFTEEKPEHKNSDAMLLSLFLITDEALFGFTTDGSPYDATSRDFESVTVGGREAIRYPWINGTASEYEFYGYNYRINIDDIREGSHLRMLVVYADEERFVDSETPELDPEVMEMIDSIVLAPAAQ